MLSPVATASLLAATDAAALKPLFEQKLSSAWDRPVATSDFVVPRVQLRGDGRLLVQYRFSTAERSWIFWGKVGHKKTGRYWRHAFAIPELRLVVPIFPFDPDLPALARAFQAAESPRVLAELREALHLGAAPRIEDVQVLGYRLGRRAVLRLRVRDGKFERSVVAKLLPPRKAARLGQLMRALSRAGFDGRGRDAIRVPRVLAESKDGILWLEDRREPSLHDQAGEAAFVPACAAAARALRRLHASVLPDLPAWPVETELAQLRESASGTAAVRPDLAAGLWETVARLEAKAPGPPAVSATLHRDFYDKQVLSGHGETTLLDVDTLAKGDPAQDVGNFLAHLVVRARQEPSAAAVLAAGRESFLAGYGELSEARCLFWEAASLVRLSCIYSLRPRWRELAVPLLEESRWLLGEGGAHA